MKKPEVITIWGNPKFASEFAFGYVKKTRKRTLICDLDFLNPSLDILLNVPKNPLRAMGELSGIAHMLEAATNNFLVQAMYDQFSSKRREAPELYILTGIYDLGEYEYVGMDLLRKIIKEASRYFDLVVLTVNANPYDACTAMAFAESDIVLHPSGTDPLSIRFFNNLVLFFAEKQQVDMGKFRYVAYLDKPITSDISFMKETTFGSYAGFISTSDFKKMVIMYGALFDRLNLMDRKSPKLETNWFDKLRREGVLGDASSSYAK